MALLQNELGARFLGQWGPTCLQCIPGAVAWDSPVPWKLTSHLISQSAQSVILQQWAHPRHQCD